MFCEPLSLIALIVCEGGKKIRSCGSKKSLPFHRKGQRSPPAISEKSIFWHPTSTCVEPRNNHACTREGTNPPAVWSVLISINWNSRAGPEMTEANPGTARGTVRAAAKT